jgi:hypothetical protein
MSVQIPPTPRVLTNVRTILRQAGNLIKIFGWPWLLLGFVASAAVGIWARSIDISGPIILVLGIVVFTQCLYLIKLPAFYRVIMRSTLHNRSYSYPLETYADWLKVNRDTYLIMFDLGGDTKGKE